MQKKLWWKCFTSILLKLRHSPNHTVIELFRLKDTIKIIESKH